MADKVPMSATREDPVNILLVDDQPAKLLTYESILGELGENLIKVSSASDALEYLLRNEVAVVLVDVVMPELDGYELAAMIRQHPRFQQTSIIFVSALMLTDLDRLRGYECGAVDYVPVPVVPEILRAKVSVFADLYRKTRALERLNAELEQRVADRTAALEATTAALQEADRRKDEFLAILAHELRNPLAPIRTAVQLLRKRDLAETQNIRAREVIERQVQHLVCLIDDLLDVSRITRGRLALHTGPVDLRTCVEQAAEANDHALSRKRQRLHLQLPQKSVDVEVDHVRMVQVVSNLIDNASKYSPEQAEVTVRVADGNVISIEVTDTGPGIAPDVLPHVFETYEQGGPAHSEGLGLGLGLCKQLVEMHGGTIEAASNPNGHGASFTIRLPRPISSGARTGGSGTDAEQMPLSRPARRR